MTDVTLVNAVFPSDVRIPPHGLLSLASSLNHTGFIVEVRDFQLCTIESPSDPIEFARFLEPCGQVLGISCMSYVVPLVLAGLELFKARNPNVHVVLGGIGVSGVAESLLEYSRDIDAIVIGEGENTIVDLTDAVRGQRSFHHVNGLAFRDEGTIVTTLPRDRLEGLESLRRPDYRAVDLSRYRAVDVQFQRGCPFPCHFCDIAPFWDRRVTSKSLATFVDDIEVLSREFGVQDVFIIDDTFVLSRDRVFGFCEELVRRQLNVEWACYARVDLLDADMTRLMAQCGCRKIFFGIESGSDRVLKGIGKEIAKAQVVQVVKDTLKEIPYVTTSFVWGFPDETMAELIDTVDLLVYLAAVGACPQFNLVVPYSYSTLFQKYKEDITFTPAYSSQLLFYGDNPPEWVLKMVKERSDLFSVFYQLPTRDFEAKWQFLREAGIDTHLWQEEYVFGSERVLPSRDGA